MLLRTSCRHHDCACADIEGQTILQWEPGDRRQAVERVVLKRGDITPWSEVGQHECQKVGGEVKPALTALGHQVPLRIRVLFRVIVLVVFHRPHFEVLRARAVDLGVLQLNLTQDIRPVCQLADGVG